MRYECRVTEETPPATVRVFIALAPPDPAKDELARELRPAYATHPQVRWNRVEDWHITLAFLGALPVDTVPLLRPRSPPSPRPAPRPGWRCTAAARSTSGWRGAGSPATSTDCTGSPTAYGPWSATAGSPWRTGRCAPI